MSWKMVEREIWRNIFADVHSRGKVVAPRGKEIIEVENYHYELPPYVRFCNLLPRKLKLEYIKQETRWYLHGDPYDLSICEFGQIWRHIIVDGKLNSNYGYAWFTQGGIDFVVEQLKQDKDSRRASTVIVDRSHLNLREKDVPCTSYINFRIRDNSYDRGGTDSLNMSVHMRSQDAIFGLGNDAPAFSFLQEMVLNLLLPTYPNLHMGTYHHTSDSFHVYEQHYDMLKQLADTCVEFEPLSVPFIAGPDEVKYLLSNNLRQQSYLDLKPERKEEFCFSKWLES